MKNKISQNFALIVFTALAITFAPSYLACKAAGEPVAGSPQSNVNQFNSSQSNVSQSSADQSNADQISVSETQKKDRTDYPNLKKQAEEMGRLLVSSDYEKSFDYLHPRALEVAGGREKLLAVMEKAMKDVKESGVEMGAYKVEDPTQIVKSGGEIFAVMPTETSAKFEGKTTTLPGALLGVSNDGGDNWKFVRIESKAALKILFPAVADKITLPKTGMSD